MIDIGNDTKEATIRVKRQGHVIIDSIALVQSGDGFAAWTLDLETKYAQVTKFTSGDGSVTLVFTPSEESYPLSEEHTGATEVGITFTDGNDWTVLSGTGRYEFPVTAHRVTI